MTDTTKNAGWSNLTPWKKGTSGNPKGKKKGTLSHKNQLKKDLKVMTWMQEDPELAAMIDNLDNVQMFDALKKTAFAMYASDPTDMTKYDRAYKAVAEDREYTEGKKVRQEVDQKITHVTEMSIEELEAELAEIELDEDDLDQPGVNANPEGSEFK